MKKIIFLTLTLLFSIPAFSQSQDENFESLRIDIYSGTEKLFIKNNQNNTVTNLESSQNIKSNLTYTFHNDNARYYINAEILRDISFRNTNLSLIYSSGKVSNFKIGYSKSFEKIFTYGFEVFNYNYPLLNENSSLYLENFVLGSALYRISLYDRKFTKIGFGQDFSASLDANEIKTIFYFRKVFVSNTIEFSINSKYGNYNNDYSSVNSDDLGFSAKISIPLE